MPNTRENESILASIRRVVVTLFDLGRPMFILPEGESCDLGDFLSHADIWGNSFLMLSLPGDLSPLLAKRHAKCPRRA